MHYSEHINTGRRANKATDAKGRTQFCCEYWGTAGSKQHEHIHVMHPEFVKHHDVIRHSSLRLCIARDVTSQQDIRVEATVYM
jgi:hypothetical protein